MNDSKQTWKDMVLKTRWAQPRTEIWRHWRKIASKPPHPQTQESPVCSVGFLKSYTISLFIVLQKAESQDEAGFYFLCLFNYLLNYLLSQQIPIDLLLCARHCSGSWRFSSDQIKDRILCSLLYPHHLEQCQAHTSYSISMCDLNWNVQSTGGHQGPHYLSWEMLEWAHR